MTASASGTPRDAYQIRIKVTRAGATLDAATAAVRLSVDGGQTYGAEQPVPTSGAVVIGDTGVTVTFTDSSDTLQLYVDNVYTCNCSAPVWDATGLGTALAALAASGPTLAHDGVVVVGDVSVTNAAVVKTSMTALIAASKPRWFLCNAEDQDVAERSSRRGRGPRERLRDLTANLMAVAAFATSTRRGSRHLVAGVVPLAAPRRERPASPGPCARQRGDPRGRPADPRRGLRPSTRGVHRRAAAQGSTGTSPPTAPAPPTGATSPASCACA
jgi:hypothetical protein